MKISGSSEISNPALRQSKLQQLQVPGEQNMQTRRKLQLEAAAHQALE